jgi:hypothetical protein
MIVYYVAHPYSGKPENKNIKVGNYQKGTRI